MERGFIPTRRGFLGLAVAGAGLAALGSPAKAAKVATKAKIVVIGAGAAGTALVNAQPASVAVLPRPLGLPSKQCGQVFS